MKRLILFMLLLLPIGAMAQSPQFKELMHEYSTQEECTTINISNALFQSMHIDIDAESMHIISIENSKLIPKFKKQIEEFVAPMTIMMSVNANNESVNIYQCNENQRIKELLIVTQEEGVCVAIYIIGDNLELNQIDSLMNIM